MAALAADALRTIVGECYPKGFGGSMIDQLHGCVEEPDKPIGSPLSGGLWCGKKSFGQAPWINGRDSWYYESIS